MARAHQGRGGSRASSVLSRGPLGEDSSVKRIDQVLDVFGVILIGIVVESAIVEHCEEIVRKIVEVIDFERAHTKIVVVVDHEDRGGAAAEFGAGGRVFAGYGVPIRPVEPEVDMLRVDPKEGGVILLVLDFAVKDDAVVVMRPGKGLERSGSEVYGTFGPILIDGLPTVLHFNAPFRRGG